MRMLSLGSRSGARSAKKEKDPIRPVKVDQIPTTFRDLPTYRFAESRCKDRYLLIMKGFCGTVPRIHMGRDSMQIANPHGCGRVWYRKWVPAIAGLALLGIAASVAEAAQGPNKEFKPKVLKTSEGIPYFTTGVGYDSRINLPRFSLKLLFSTRTQKYLANIDVEISPGPTGKPIQIKSLGPWLHVDLSPGKYAVKARTSKGQEIRDNFVIRKGSATRVKMIWDISDADI